MAEQTRPLPPRSVSVYPPALADLTPAPPDFLPNAFHPYANPPAFTPAAHQQHYTLPPIPNTAPPPAPGFCLPRLQPHPPPLPLPPPPYPRRPDPSAVRTHLLDAVLRHHPTESLSSRTFGYQGSNDNTAAPTGPIATLPAHFPPHSASSSNTSPLLYHMMPSAPRPHRPTSHTFPATTAVTASSSSGVVDLTAPSSAQDNATMPPQTRGMKRRHSDTTSEEPPSRAASSAKRRKSNTGASQVPQEDGEHGNSSGISSTAAPVQHSPGQQRGGLTAIDGTVDQLDLTGDKPELEDALQRQREEAVRSQQEARDKPLRLSNLTCVICMDTPTDLTATSCGHLFCHTCLMEALIAGESRAGPGEAKKSQCPVCRKNISRNKVNDIVPLLLMKKGMGTQPRKNKAVMV